MLNHPFWRYFDILPETLIALPHVHFYEVNNARPLYKVHPDWYSLEKFQYGIRINFYLPLPQIMVILSFHVFGR